MECYPVAKAGGLGDVVGSLPKYLIEQNVKASVVMPKYHNAWNEAHSYETVFEGGARLGDAPFSFRVQREQGDTLGFPLYGVDIPGRYDRPGVYIDPESGFGYWDELERCMSFQIAVLDWIRQRPGIPDIIHCHDHQTALVPFLMTQCAAYDSLKSIPTVLTVHNGQYHGEYDHTKDRLLPDFDLDKIGLLDWDGKLNCLATGLKCCWQISTVSQSYLDELSEDSNGLEWLFASERQKSRGIVNGIDTSVWDPQSDTFLENHYSANAFKRGKNSNKKELCEQFGLDPRLPTISFIGRLAAEKGADLLPGVIERFLYETRPINFIILGTGDPGLHKEFRMLNQKYVGFFNATLDYNESLAHLIYAGSDFLIMPSRVEPCGLNQMYAMRYGTIPIVRNIGGLKDTVVDLDQPGGYGITFSGFNHDEAAIAVERAIGLDEKHINTLRKKIMKLDFSWNASAKEYIEMYRKLLD